MKGWLVAAAVGPKVLGRAGRLQFVKVVCSVWAGAQPWFALTTIPFEQREVFKTIPS